MVTKIIDAFSEIGVVMDNSVDMGEDRTARASNTAGGGGLFGFSPGPKVQERNPTMTSRLSRHKLWMLKGCNDGTT